VRDQSVGAALVLTFLFGPLGLLYVSVLGAILLSILAIRPDDHQAETQCENGHDRPNLPRCRRPCLHLPRPARWLWVA